MVGLPFAVSEPAPLRLCAWTFRLPAAANRVPVTRDGTAPPWPLLVRSVSICCRAAMLAPMAACWSPRSVLPLLDASSLVMVLYCVCSEAIWMSRSALMLGEAVPTGVRPVSGMKSAGAEVV